MTDITGPKNILIEIQIRPQFLKDTRVLYVHVDGETALRVCRIPDDMEIQISGLGDTGNQDLTVATP